MTQEEKDNFMQEVAEIYMDTGSLQQTADKLGIAYAKVRKLLITSGKYETPFSKDVYSLRCKGYSVDEIARKLGTSSNRVSAWLPYERIIYNAPDKSLDAVRCSEYRKRIGVARENSIARKYIYDKETPGETAAANASRFIRDNERQTETATARAIEKSLHDAKGAETPIPPGEPVRLHLELQCEDLDEDALQTLKTHGYSSDGSSFTRDILIPADMTLHALHYAIQKSFGWQNGHLHSFHLPDDVYEELTGNTVRGWGALIGVLFQTIYPDNVWSERYGDDDYKTGSHKTWLKKKYTGPYDYLGYYEQYGKAADGFKDFIGSFSQMDVYEPFSFETQDHKIIKRASTIDLTIDELNASIILEDGTTDLLERLLVSSVLAPAGAGTAGAGQLNQRMVARRYRGYGEVEEPEVKPVTHKLLYLYDYGDGWAVEITRPPDCGDLLSSGLITAGKLETARNTVTGKHKPVCLHHDGMLLLDDVGGIGGFVDMLRTLFDGPDTEERRSKREWAGFMGWSPRKPSNEALL